MIATRRRRVTRARCPWIALAVLSIGVPVSALAQDAAHDPITAEALFERGKQLMDQGKTGEACAAFDESNRLDPAGGTLLRLALCHESAGKLASAWLEFLEVIRVSKEGTGEPAKLQERVRLARDHLAAVEPRVPKLAIAVAPTSRVDGLRVSANGLPRNASTWGVPLPVDPGDVVVVASAPGHQDFRATVRIVEGQQQMLDVPALVRTGPAPAAAASDMVSPPAQRSSLVRPIGIGVGVLGVAALGVGTYFGIHAIQQWNTSSSECPAASCTNADGVSRASDAKTAATVSDVTLGVGAAAVVLGVVLYLVGAPTPIEAQGTNAAITVRF
jgi:hypothetical protein